MARSLNCRVRLSLAPLLTLALWGAAPWAVADQSRGKETKPRPENRLARESSPYLRQHARNPVDWYPWGPEAFAKAKKENKLVFLSIGYSSCHWCHVMERESFDNEEVAKLMNQWFVCIKVDREERPDVDNVYMTALHVVGGRGGWPLSMFLTADGKPVLGGTYWPPDDKEVQGEKIRGFKSVLKIMHDWYREKPKEIEEQSVKVAALTAEALAGAVRGIALVELNRDLVAGAVEGVKEGFDKEYGGFGNPEGKFRGPKFPTPPYIRLLQHEAARTKSAELSRMVYHTLDRMARGGIYDHLGGGFHRYTVERTWTVPHFEKMLYDNAQLLEAYAQAYEETKNPLYQRVLQETVAFVKRELTAPEGGFYSALDADSEGAEGRFYVWTEKDLAEALQKPEDVELVKRVYSTNDKPNFEEKYFIPLLPRPLGETAKGMNLTEEELTARLEPLRRRLFEVRAKRERPFLDTKVLTSWNGQMIAGLALASRAIGKSQPAPAPNPYVNDAVRAADFVLRNLRTADGRLLRTWSTVPGQPGAAKLNAYLDDYAYLVHGLLCLHDATGHARWLDEAKALTEVMVKHHHDEKAGGFFYTSHDHEKLFARAKDQYDGAQPSGNSMAARNLVRLWRKTGEDRYRALAEKTFKAFAGSLKLSGSGLTTMAEALSMYLDAQAAAPAGATNEARPQGNPTRSDSVVKVAAKAEKPDADGKQLVTITLTIDKGWHVYANPVGAEDLAAAQTTVSFGKVKPEDVRIEYPKGTEVEDKVVGKYRTFQGTVTIKATVQRAKGDAGPLEVAVKFQACTKQQCLLPATVKVTVP